MSRSVSCFRFVRFFSLGVSASLSQEFLLDAQNGGFAFHSGKILKELVQSLPAIEVIQQGLEGDASPAEHRGPSKNIRVSTMMPLADAIAGFHLEFTRANSGKPTVRS